MKNLFVLLLFLFGCDTQEGLVPDESAPNKGAPNESIAAETLTISVLAPDIDQAVTFVSKGGYSISFRLVCVNASADTVIDKLFSEGFNLGDSVNEARTRIGNKMQDEIDAYQEIQTIFSSAAYSNSAAVIQAGLDGGI